MNVSLRRAEPRDVDFFLELMTHEDVDPYMAVVRPRDRDSGRERRREAAPHLPQVACGSRRPGSICQ